MTDLSDNGRLARIEESLSKISVQLATTLLLKGDVDSLTRDMQDHELRLIALEQIQSNEITRQSVWAKVRTFAYGVGSAILALSVAAIGGGYLPKFWGG